MAKVALKSFQKGNSKKMLKLRTTILNNFELIYFFVSANVTKQINLYQNRDRKILLRNDPK